MNDYKDSLTVIDERNTGFIGIAMLNQANFGPINPEKGQLVLWQEGRRDVNRNDVPTLVCNFAMLGKEAVVNEVLRCLTKCGSSEGFEITSNVLEHTQVWRIWN